MAEQDKIKVGVIGVGHLGSSHARIYSNLDTCELTGVCDTNKRQANSVARKNKTTAFINYEDLYDKVDAVSIVVPTILHHKIAKDFLKKGISVLLEKPMTTNIEEADELLKIAGENQCILQVGHIERFNSAVETIQQLCEGPRFIDCQRLGPFTKRGTDVGVVLDLMIHDIDIVLAMVNSPIKSIDAVGIHVLTNHEDIANARIRFENGTVCNLSASRITKDRTRKIRLFAENMYISLDYMKQKAAIHTKSGKKIKHKFLNIKKEEPLKKELQAFINCVLTKETPLVSGEEGRAALAAALEIQRQIREYGK